MDNKPPHYRTPTRLPSALKPLLGSARRRRQQGRMPHFSRTNTLALSLVSTHSPIVHWLAPYPLLILSLSPHGERIHLYLLQYYRFMHSEPAGVIPEANRSTYTISRSTAHPKSFSRAAFIKLPACVTLIPLQNKHNKNAPSISYSCHIFHFFPQQQLKCPFLC